MIQIRKSRLGDETAIYELIKELAVYENAPDAVTNTISELKKHLFEDKICDALIATNKNEVVGFTLFYISYSTWKGKCLYLEDFYVKKNFRKNGIGELLFNETIEIAKSIKAQRMDWQVLEWNDIAINFYKKQNTQLDSGWVNGRISLNN